MKLVTSSSRSDDCTVSRDVRKQRIHVLLDGQYIISNPLVDSQIMFHAWSQFLVCSELLEALTHCMVEIMTKKAHDKNSALIFCIGFDIKDNSQTTVLLL